MTKLDNVKMIFEVEMMVDVSLDEPKVLLPQKMSWKQTNKGEDSLHTATADESENKQTKEKIVYLSNVQLMIHQDQHLYLSWQSVLCLIGGSYQKMNLTLIKEEMLSIASADASLCFPVL